MQVTVPSVTRLLKRFNYNSIYDADAVVMEFREYKSLPDSHLPMTHKNALEQFWALMAEKPRIVGESNVKQFGHLVSFCKTLLILPHSTADPERLFSMISKVDTSQQSNLHAQTVCDLLSVKINNHHECYESDHIFTPEVLCHAKTATTRSLNKS